MSIQATTAPRPNYASQKNTPGPTIGTAARSRPGAIVVAHPEGTDPGAHRDAPEVRPDALRATNAIMTNTTTTASGRRPCVPCDRQSVAAPVPVTTRDLNHRSTTRLPTGTNHQPRTYHTHRISLTTRNSHIRHPTTRTTRSTSDSSYSQESTTACSTK